MKTDPYTVLKCPLSTEKSIRQIEFNNIIVFLVDSNANKKDIKESIESLYKVKVVSVNIDNSITGQKKAYIKLGKEHSASDLSADLGLL